MIQSMTGYGKATVELPDKKINVEIKSLNSKAMDLSARIAPLYREKEMEIRNEISRKLERGKVDFSLWIEKKESAESATPINQVAAISSPDPRSLLIKPWDGSLLKAIEKAIQTSDLGINPQNDGSSIRLSFPQLTEERRKELTKQVKKYAENGKVAIRNIRRDAMDKFKAMQKKSEITEDECKEYEKDLQDMTDKRCKQLDELAAKKETELMAV